MRGQNGSQVRPDRSGNAGRRSQARRPRDPHGRTPDALAPARRRQPPVQGAGLAGTSISDIAAAADAFPSQITYYFRTKEALFVEAACRDMLYLARAAEQAALQAHTPREYTRALVETVTATDSVAFFAEALTLTRRRQDLAPLVERTIERLHSEGMRAYAGQIERHGWRSLRDRRRELAAVLGGRDRRDGRGPCDGPLGRGNVRRDAARAGRSGDGQGRRRQRRLRLVGDPDASTPMHPTGRPRHDRASHACPRFPERGSIDRRPPARRHGRASP